MKIPTGKIAQGFIILVIAGLCFVLIGGVWKGKAQKSRQESAESCPSDPEMKLSDMEFTEMQQGKRFWNVCASEAKYFQDEQKSLLQTVHMTFYLETGEEIHITSREGILYAGTKNLELRGSVRAALPRNYVLTVERAFYDHQKKLMWSEDPVHISGPGLELDGNRLEYKMPEHLASVVGKVNVSLVGSQLNLDKTPLSASAAVSRKQDVEN